MTQQFQQESYEGTPAAVPPRNKAAVAAIVVGGVAFVVGWVPGLGLILGLGAVVLGVLAIRKAAAFAGRGRALGITSIVLGGLAALTNILVTVIAVAAGPSTDDATGSTASAPSASAPAETSQAPAPSATEEASPEPSETTPDPEPTTEASAPEPAAPAAPAAALGVPVTSGDLTFVVNSFSCGVKHVGSEYFGADAQGQYCQAELAVTNNGNDANYFTDSQATLVSASGQNFSASSDSIYLENSAGLFDQINPGNTLSGTILFDVPDGADLASLELRDGLFDKAVSVPV